MKFVGPDYTCRFCGGEVERVLGKFMIVFAHGKGPQAGNEYMLCGPCAAGVI